VIKVDKKRVLKRLDSLIVMGGMVSGTRHDKLFGGMKYIDRVQEDIFYQWKTSSLSFLNILPSDIYYKQFEGKCKDSGYSDTECGLGILRAAREDIEGGYLQRIETLVSASVFTDFLEMAEHLLDNAYKDPAASLIGAVLEDGLRRICANSGVTLKAREDISSLSQKLLQKQVYNPLQHKQIQVWNDIRNNADHGNFGEYKAGDVAEMLKGVSSFLSNYLK
jgi:hypothetical protein